MGIKYQVVKKFMFRFVIFLMIIWMPLVAFSADDKKPTAIFSDALLFAELANAVYEDKTALQAMLGQNEFKLNEFANVPGVEVSYALLTNALNKQHIVVVRGTANVENALVDMDVKLIADQQTGIRLHQGFLQAATPIFQKLKSNLNKDYEIITAGHSLGGAVAVILAMQLQSDGFNVAKIVTFGQPKVTNVEGANKFANLNLLRFVRPKDLVPIVPPIDPMEIKNLDIYWHLGREIILMENNEYAELQGLKSMLRSGDFVTTAPNQENLDSHKMGGYLGLIKNNSLQATGVEYKSSFNPLKFFSNN